MSARLAVLGLDLARGIASPADAIPGQVPEAVVLVTQVRDPWLHLRGDFEAPDQILVVASDAWPRTSRRLVEEIRASGTSVGLVREFDMSEAAYARLVQSLGPAGLEGVEILSDAVDTAWVRDWGPIQLRASDGASTWLDAELADPNRRRDDGAPAWLAAAHGRELGRLPWRLDGGAVISNGQGLCVVTFDYFELDRRSWREAELSQLAAALGCRVTAVVPTLVDEATKHADMIAQFVSPNRVVLAALPAAASATEDGLRLAAVEQGLRLAATAFGVTLEVVAVPTPATVPGRNPRTYVNGLRLGDRYLMPSYPELGEPAQRAAEAALAAAMPDLAIVRVDASELIGAGGALHCATLGLFF